MQIFPYKQLTITSRRSPSELSSSLIENSESKLFGIRFGGIGKPLIGTFEGTHFKLRRAIIYRNSFIPVAIGKISPHKHGSIVDVTLRMNKFVIIFMCAWFSISSIFATKEIYSYYFESENMSLFGVGAFIVGYIMMQGGFWLEVPKITKILMNIASDSN
ncbi:MAG: hypothetical protein OEZ47_13515 [Gammaproteobacteria bacterium]|nr:hypothetical protein [Gammaproteobacteria bacterium]